MKGDFVLKHYCENMDAVLAEAKSSAEGLSSKEASDRLLANGKNKLAEGKKIPCLNALSTSLWTR